MLRLACQVQHHEVKQWLHHGRNEHMSAKAYRAHALAELASSATFNYRCDPDAAPLDALNRCSSGHASMKGITSIYTRFAHVYFWGHSPVPICVLSC